MIIYVRKFSNYINRGLLVSVNFLFRNYINLLFEFIKALCIDRFNINFYWILF